MRSIGIGIATVAVAVSIGFAIKKFQSEANGPSRATNHQVAPAMALHPTARANRAPVVVVPPPPPDDDAEPANIHEREPKNDARLDDVYRLIHENRVDAAIGLLNEMIKENPKNDRALEELGILYAHDPVNRDKAEEYLTKALIVNPRNTSAREELFAVYSEEAMNNARNGDTKGALATYVKLVSAQEQEIARLRKEGGPAQDLEHMLIDSKLGYASVLMNDRRWDEAEIVLKSLTEKDAGNKAAEELLKRLTRERRG